MSGASERANGRASVLVLTSRFLFVPDRRAAAEEEEEEEEEEEQEEEAEEKEEEKTKDIRKEKEVK